MKPYYEHGGVTIYHGDCMDVLPRIGGPVHCVLTDPPYGIGWQSRRLGGIAGDEQIPTEWAQHLKRLCASAARIYWFVGDAGITPAQECLLGLGFTLSRMLVWDKCAATRGDMSDYGNRVEYIVAARAQGYPTALRAARDTNLIAVPRVDPRVMRHPTEKPLPLMSYLIVRSTDPGELVLDPFMGSGTTLVASRDLGRKAVGVESDERWCELAAKRLEQEVLDLGGAA